MLQSESPSTAPTCRCQSPHPEPESSPDRRLAASSASSTPPTYVERLLGHVVEIAVDQRLERLHRLLDRHVDARRCPVNASADEERLGQEPLDLPGPGHDHLVFLGELVEAEDGDDVLELLVTLEHLADPTRHVVVIVARPLRGRGWSTSTPTGQPPGRCPAPAIATRELGRRVEVRERR